MATVSTSRVVARAKKDPKFKERALKNPGLRSQLPASMVGKKVVAQRALTARLNAPVAPGSTMTGRDLAHQAAADTAVKYGPIETDQQRQVNLDEQRKRDVGGWYDQYLAQLAEGTKNVAAIQQAADARLQALGSGVTGIATADLNQLQGQANADAAKQGVAAAGNLAPTADAAAKVRQNLVGAFQAQQAIGGAAQNTYMQRQAYDVAPTQKLGALAEQQGLISQARQKQSDTAAEKAAFNLTDRKDITNREQQYGLAAAGLNIKADSAAADAAAKTPAAQAKVTAAKESARNAGKYGYSVAEWKALGPKGQARIVNANRTKPANHKLTSGPFTGKTQSEVDAMSTAQIQAATDAYDKRKGSKSKGGKGPGWQTPEQTGSAMTQLGLLKTAAANAKSGKPFDPGHKPQPALGRQPAGAKIKDYVGSKLKNPVLVTAALDAIYDGHLSAGTVKALIQAGYRPSEVARTLGVRTAGQVKPAKLSPAERAPQGT